MCEVGPKQDQPDETRSIFCHTYPPVGILMGAIIGHRATVADRERKKAGISLLEKSRPWNEHATNIAGAIAIVKD